jgi:hypothetical protein
MDATAKFVAIVAVAAFATERIIAAIEYLLDAQQLAGPGGTAERRKLFLFVVAAVIAYVVVDRANLRLLHVLQVDHVTPAVDFWLTWLVVVAGADRVRAFLGQDDERDESPVVRIQVDGGEVRELHRVR